MLSISWNIYLMVPCTLRAEEPAAGGKHRKKMLLEFVLMDVEAAGGLRTTEVIRNIL